MKIEIDLNDILGDEYGSQETIAESIRRQIIENLSKGMKDRINLQIKEETNRILNEEMQCALKDRMPAILDDVMSAPYTVIDRYGGKGETTTFRDQLVKTVAQECVYKPVKNGFASDENAFTRGIKQIVESQMAIFKAEWDAKITAQFRQDCITYAVQELSKKLGLVK